MSKSKSDSSKETDSKDVSTSSGDIVGNSVIDVSQEWMGGESGKTVPEWRASLAEETNGNWKIIDRYAEECVGIWTFIHDDMTMWSRICSRWRDLFTGGSNFSAQGDVASA